MIPSAAVPVARASDRAASDRMFYSGMALLIAAIVFVGFAPTFYLRTIFNAPTLSGETTLTPLAQFHGAIFTLWVLLFAVQTSLVASRRVALHRKLGWAGAGLAAVMMVVGLATAAGALRRGSGPPGIEPAVFFVVPVFDMLLFVPLITLAVLKRKEKETHKRLMLLAYIALTPAAFGRIAVLAPLGLLGVFGFAYSLSLLGAAYDLWSRGRIATAYRWAIPALFLSVPARLALSTTPLWHAFAAWVAR